MRENYFSPEFDYYAIKRGGNSNIKTDFISEIEVYIQKLEKIGINKNLNLGLKDVLATSVIVRDVSDSTISKAMMVTSAIINNLQDNEIWGIFHTICPPVIDQIDVKWVSSLILPDMVLESGRMGVYKKCLNNYEIRLALGVQNGSLNMSKDVLIRGIWWYVIKIIVFEIIGNKYSKNKYNKILNGNFLSAIHICLFKMIINFCGKGEENITVGEALLRQRFYLSARLYKDLEDHKPEKWLTYAEDWLTRMVENRNKRQVQ